MCGKASRAAAFPRFFRLCGRFPACSLGRGSLNWGIDTKAQGRETPVIDQCVWAGNWDLRESIAKQAGMDFHPRGKARSLPCSMSPQEMLGKLARAGARDQEFGTRLRWEQAAAAQPPKPACWHRWLQHGCSAAAWLLPQADGVPGKYCAPVSPHERGAGRFGWRCWGRGWMRLPRAGLCAARRGLLTLLWAMGQRLISAAREGSFNWCSGWPRIPCFVFLGWLLV